MEFTIESGGDGPQDVSVTFSGVANPEAFGRYNAAASDRPSLAGMAVLVDLSALDTSQLSDDDLQALSAPMIERDLVHPPLAVAIVASNERTFADAIHHRAHLGGSKSHREVFASREAALVWLDSQRRLDAR
jgi:hypothetical protein